MDDNFIKFGPEWLRNFATRPTRRPDGREGSQLHHYHSGGVSDGAASRRSTRYNNNQSSASNTTTARAKLRYGREEMLALFDKNNLPTSELRNCEEIFKPRPRVPVALYNSIGFANLRESVRGAGAMDNRYRGHGQGQGSRGRGRSEPARWWRQTSTDEEWRNESSRSRQPHQRDNWSFASKSDFAEGHSTSRNNSNRQEKADDLPEWARDEVVPKGMPTGTFDSSGAFHGGGDDASPPAQPNTRRYGWNKNANPHKSSYASYINRRPNNSKGQPQNENTFGRSNYDGRGKYAEPHGSKAASEPEGGTSYRFNWTKEGRPAPRYKKENSQMGEHKHPKPSSSSDQAEDPEQYAMEEKSPEASAIITEAVASAVDCDFSVPPPPLPPLPQQNQRRTQMHTLEYYQANPPPPFARSYRAPMAPRFSAKKLATSPPSFTSAPANSQAFTTTQCEAPIVSGTMDDDEEGQCMTFDVDAITKDDSEMHFGASSAMQYQHPQAHTYTDLNEPNDGGHFKSVMIPSNNLLRSKHQNVTSMESEQMKSHMMSTSLGNEPFPSFDFGMGYPIMHSETDPKLFESAHPFQAYVTSQMQNPNHNIHPYLEQRSQFDLSDAMRKAQDFALAPETQTSSALMAQGGLMNMTSLSNVLDEPTLAPNIQQPDMSKATRESPYGQMPGSFDMGCSSLSESLSIPVPKKPQYDYMQIAGSLFNTRPPPPPPPPPPFSPPMPNKEMARGYGPLVDYCGNRFPVPKALLLDAWYYEDPTGKIQGPFKSEDMMNWHLAGFFNQHMLIRNACEKTMNPIWTYGVVPPYAPDYMTDRVMPDINAKCWETMMPPLPPEEPPQYAAANIDNIVQETVDPPEENEDILRLLPQEAIQNIPSTKTVPVKAANVDQAKLTTTCKSKNKNKNRKEPSIPTEKPKEPEPKKITQLPWHHVVVEGRGESPYSDADDREWLVVASKRGPSVAKERKKAAAIMQEEPPIDQYVHKEALKPVLTPDEYRMLQQEPVRPTIFIPLPETTLPKKAPWSALGMQTLHGEPMSELTLAEIQRLEREKKMEAMREHRLALEKLAPPPPPPPPPPTQQPEEPRKDGENNVFPWSVKNAAPAGVSVADVPAKVEKHVEARELKAAAAALAAAFAVPTAMGSADKLISEGTIPIERIAELLFEKSLEKPTVKPVAKPVDKPADNTVEKPADKPTEKTAEKPADKPVDKPASKPVEKQHTSKPVEKHNTKTASKCTTKAAEKPSSSTKGRKKNAHASGAHHHGSRNSKSPTPLEQFESWCHTALSVWSSTVDVPTFVIFLREIESPYEIKDYVKLYLGESKESSDFARLFLERRSKMLRSSVVVPDDDLCSPAAAVTPRNLSGGEHQDAKGKPKKPKKNKMVKVDSSILGFSVTASPERFNVGNIEKHE